MITLGYATTFETMIYPKTITLAVFLAIGVFLSNNPVSAFAPRYYNGVGSVLSPSHEKSGQEAVSPRIKSTHLDMWSSDEDIEGIDKYKSCVPYLLPLLDGEHFGKYIYEHIPPLGFLDSLFIGPLYENFSQIPFLPLLLFIGLTLGTRGNTDMSRGLRFNAQQAALIDVSLIAPELVASAFQGEDIPRYLQEPCMNFVWYTYMAMVMYSIVSNLRGKKPDQIPWISDYSEMMVGPF
jgi:hypothetical protein